MVDCGVLSTPGGGQQTTTGSALGDTASFTCALGFDLGGSAARTCQIDDSWSGSDTTCACKLLFDIINRIAATKARPYTITMMNMGWFVRRQKWRQQSSLDDQWTDYHSCDAQKRRSISYSGSILNTFYCSVISWAAIFVTNNIDRMGKVMKFAAQETSQASLVSWYRPNRYRGAKGSYLTLVRVADRIL